MRVVLDTTIIISGLNFRRTERLILELARVGRGTKRGGTPLVLGCLSGGGCRHD